MSRLPRFPADAPAKGKDLNLILSIMDTGGVINLTSVTNSGITGDGLSPTVPNVSGSVSPTPGGVGAPVTPRGFSGSYGIDNYAQAHTAFVVLTWTPNPVSDFVSRYDIYYHRGSDPTLYNLSVGGDVDSCRVNNLFPDNSYSFAIQAHDAANRTSSWTPEITIYISADVDPPAVPTNLSATSTEGGVYLTWTEVGPEGLSNDLKEYKIAVSTDGGATYPTTRTTGPGNSYLYVPTTANQGTVFFQIATVDWTGNVSAFSSAVSAVVGTILGPVTINPGPLTVVGIINTSIVPGSSNPVTIIDNAATSTQMVQEFRVAGTRRATLRTDSSGNVVLSGSGTGGVYLAWDEGTGQVNIGHGLTITAGGETITAGNLALTAGVLIMGATTSQIVPGATRFQIQNNANNATNIDVLDAGTVTFRNQLKVPPSAGGTVAATSYGSVPVKINEIVSGAAAASLTISSIPGGFRDLLNMCALGTTAAGLGIRINAQFNGDTAANYDYYHVEIHGAFLGTGTDGYAVTALQVGSAEGSSGPIQNSPQQFWVHNYSNTGIHKFTNGYGSHLDAASAGNWYSEKDTGRWRSNSAITSILLAPVSSTFVAGGTWIMTGIP